MKSFFVLSCAPADLIFLGTARFTSKSLPLNLREARCKSTSSISSDVSNVTNPKCVFLSESFRITATSETVPLHMPSKKDFNSSSLDSEGMPLTKILRISSLSKQESRMYSVDVSVAIFFRSSGIVSKQKT